MNYLSIISEITGVKPKDIVSETRIPKVSEARQMCMYFYKIQNGISYAGRILKKNHGTIHYGHKRISDLLSVKDKRTVELYNRIIEASSSRTELNFYYGLPNL